MRVAEECASLRLARLWWRKKTRESVVLRVDVGVLFLLVDYIRGQTKKERQGENHTCFFSSSALSFLILSFLWFSVSEP